MARITLREVAEQAGVGKATVSAVLSGKHPHVRVSEETRRRIMDAVERTAYRPHAVARSLSIRATNAISVYLGRKGALNALHPIGAQIIGGLQEGCDAHNKDLLLYNSLHDASPQDIVSELTDGRVDGIVVFDPPHDDLVKPLVRARLPLVALIDALPLVSSVVVDDAGGVTMIVEYLATQGYRSLFTLTPHDRGMDDTSITRRYRALQVAAGRHGMALTTVNAPDVGSGDALLDAWQTAGKPAKSVAVCKHDHLAYDVLTACERRGIRVPEEVAITGFDAAIFDPRARRKLTTIHAPWSVVAKTAVGVLAAQIRGEKTPAETVIPVSLVVGSTT